MQCTALTTLVLALGLVLPGPAPRAAEEESRTGDHTELRRYMEAGLAEGRIPGAAAAVVEDGRIVLAEGFGRRDASGGRVTAQTPFQIASISKSFTALIVLQLAAENRLAIDDPVIRHVPAFRLGDPAHSRAVTLRHLLDHRSGFSTRDGNLVGCIDADDPDATGKAVRALAGARPQAAPGERFVYSNANYIVLGHVIEELEQAPYEAVLERRILAPLGMADSRAGGLPGAAVEEARGHAQWFGLAISGHHRPGRATLAAGGIAASAEDLATYLRALVDRDPRVVPPLLARSWEDPSFRGYAFGWYHLRVDGRRVILHDGLNPGFRARAMILPDERRAAVVLVNAAGILDGNLPLAAAHRALDLPPVALGPSTAMTAALYGSLAMAGCFLLGCILALRKAYRVRHRPWPFPEALRWALVLIPPAALAGGAWALLVLVPRSLALDFGGIRAFYPDLAALLLAMAATALLWAILLPYPLLQRPRSPR